MEKSDVYDMEKMQSFKRLGMTLHCIEAYEDVLLCAVKGGQILEYKSHFVFDTNKNKQTVRMACTTYNIFPKPVTKMKAIPQCSLLLAVYDNVINVHDLNTYELKDTLTSTKGVTLFDVFIKETLVDKKKLQGKVIVKLCVAIGRYLKVLVWNQNNSIFEDLETDLKVSQNVKGLLWCRDLLFVGVKDEYFVLKPNTEEIHDIFTFGNEQKEPIMTGLDKNTMLLGYNNTSIFVNPAGKQYKDFSINWSGIPQFIVYDPPYVVAVLDRYVEVRSVDPTIALQRMDIKNVSAVAKGSEIIFLETLSSVHMLTLRPWRDRVKGLIHQKHFELALDIVTLSDGPTEEIDKIKAQSGVHLFCKHQYAKCLDLFSQLNTDPAHVVGLYPDMLPSKLRNSLHYPEKIPAIPLPDINTAIQALITYLQQKRKMLDTDEELVPFSPIMVHYKGNETLKTKTQALSVIDTTLLKCYIEINQCSMVARLLHDPNNNVSIMEAEKILLEKHQFSELIILYENHKMHSKALAMMKEQSTRTKSPLYGVDMTIHYLQKLGTDNIALLYEHAEWVLQTDAYDGLKIFTSDEKLVRELPRGHVLSFIEKVNKDLGISYLEHVIYEWHDETEELHMTLAHHLRLKVTDLYHKYNKDKPQDYKHPKAGTEPGLLGKYRKKLLHFLESTHVYKPILELEKFPLNSFFEERTVLLGRMGRHEEALGICVYILEGLTQAEDYCYKHYNRERKQDKDVYFYLLKVYLQPPTATTLGLTEYTTQPEPNIRAALNVLENNAATVDLQKALSILPDDIPMSREISMYLETSYDQCIRLRHLYEVCRKMQYEDYLQVSEEFMVYSKNPIVVDDKTSCNICQKKIGNSFFAYYPNGAIAHYGCSKDFKYIPLPTSELEEEMSEDFNAS